MKPLRVGVVCDLREEEWPSMDVVADKLVEALRRDFRNVIDPVPLRPAMRPRATRLPGLARHPRARIIDRLANRHFDYPRWLSGQRDGFDLFHIADHSYAQLVRTLPAERTVVTCHDLDAFRCVLRPEEEPRSSAFQALVRTTLDGLQHAARIACVSAAVRDELLASGRVDAARVRVVPNGVDEAFSPDADAQADAEAARLLGGDGRTLDVLHVSSVIPRKRVDVLLGAAAVIMRTDERIRLVHVGGPLTAEQLRLASTLGVKPRIVSVPFVETRVLAAIYRRAVVCLLPSDREGFGLPLLEALASGVPAVASNIASLRETGGDAAIYAAPGHAEAFARAALGLIAEDPDAAAVRRRRGVEHARAFTWRAHAAAMTEIYRELA